MLPLNRKCTRLCQGWSGIFADAMSTFAPRVFALQVSLGFFKARQKNILK